MTSRGRALNCNNYATVGLLYSLSTEVHDFTFVNSKTALLGRVCDSSRSKLISLIALLVEFIMQSVRVVIGIYRGLVKYIWLCKDDIIVKTLSSRA